MSSETNSQRRLAVQMNNEAVYQIASGENSKAIENLTFALNECKQILARERRLETEQTILTLDQCMVQSEEFHYHEGKGVKDCNIYGQGIYIPFDVSLDSHSNVMISTILIFNLALAQQTLESSPNKNKLTQAARLYDLVFHIQRDGQLRDNVYFMLATINNLGVVYRQLGTRKLAANALNSSCQF